ncbi:glutathione peroxidase [Paenibacillus amylolyticus]|uniref:Glutathione peroxidase n=1 Tax=Paenibacillus amylolyticus TaxID=1451 RepID=A0AAP5H1C2_PAEAM|nr:glutathione peroxidase [Paenibacillus amylolyticus]MDR6724440.1 glutathione peroxidase [Paenibacillus amylolyticus]
MSFYDMKIHTIDGTPADLARFRGKVLLVVNTASKCSYSRQFTTLQQLYEKYHHDGLEILAFPCNQFNEKEPGDNSEVKAYCENLFKLTFPLFEKIEVRGQNVHPIYQFLTAQAPFQGFDTETASGEWMKNFLNENYPDIYMGDGIKWNFTKFLIDRNGQVHGRYETTTEPLEIEPIIKSLLSK